MINCSILGSNLKRGILRFSERISEGQTRPDFKFISQMIYGILAAQSCHLSKIGRALQEQISIKKTIDHLSLNLSTFNGGTDLFANYIHKMKSCLSDKSILIVDGSDITKPCSPAMEHIGRVRDGSSGDYGNGYHTLGVTALTPGQKQPIGVYTRVYSASEQGFISEDEEVLTALRFLGKH